jgi:hypothetical protein
MSAIGEAATELLEAGLEAEGRVARVSIPLSGRRIVTRESLEATAGIGIARRVEDIVGLLSGQHATTKQIFAEAEECFQIVLAGPNAAKVHEARLQMEVLDDRWRDARADLAKVLKQRARKEGLAPHDAKTHVDSVLKQLDTMFNSRYAFTVWTSRVGYDQGPEEVRRILREELAKKPHSAKEIDELTDFATSLPFLRRPPMSPAKPPGRGLELHEEFRRLAEEAKKAAGQAKPSVFGKPSLVPDATTLARQARALDELARFHPEGDVLYDDIVDIVDAAFDRQRQAAGAAGLGDPAFIKDLVDKVQGRIGETLALRHPRFVADVWKPAIRTAEDLAARLNARLGDVPIGQRWRVEVITEPTLATTERGRAEQLMDSGIWLVQETPQGNTAMPIFGLEVKSGEVETSIQQLVLNLARTHGGLVKLPGSNRTFKMTFPPEVEFQMAIASTRTITDKRVLGKLKGTAPVEERSLAPGQAIFMFRLPMPYSQIRDSARACVVARLNQLKKAAK